MRPLLVLLCAAAFGLLGCGGDDDDTGSDGPGDGTADAAGSGPDAREPSDPSFPDAGEDDPDGGGKSDGCQSSNTINDVTYEARCTSDGVCDCVIDDEPVDKCKLDDPEECNTTISNGELTAGCCEFDLP